MVNGSCLTSGSGFTLGATGRSARADLHAAHLYFILPCSHPLHAVQLFFRLPCGHGLQSAHLSFRLPCGQGLQAKHLSFSLPCGQGLQSAHKYFSLPCGHGLHTLQCAFSYHGDTACVPPSPREGARQGRARAKECRRFQAKRVSWRFLRRRFVGAEKKREESCQPNTLL